MKLGKTIGALIREARLETAPEDGQRTTINAQTSALRKADVPLGRIAASTSTQ